MRHVVRPASITALALCLGLLGACSTPPSRSTASTRADAKAVGYLDAAALPDSLALLPPPPAPGSAGAAFDQAVSQQALALHDAARLAQARRDADLSFPAGADLFACALGAPINAEHTPHLYRLLERSRIDASAATKAAKNHYQRTRPFVLNHAPVCTPDDEAHLRGSGSYPSGHTTIGWAWALILGEADPAHADALAQRGRSFGESRLVCNVHWQSDIIAGRVIGAATVARLHDDPTFLADLAAARREIAAARAQGLQPARDCAAESAALRVRPESAL